MLVPVPKPVEFVEQYYIVPFLVRLYGRYPITNRIGESAYLREITVSKGGSGPVEFETDAVVRLEDLSMPQTKLSGGTLRLWITSPAGNLIDGGGC